MHVHVSSIIRTVHTTFLQKLSRKMNTLILGGNFSQMCNVIEYMNKVTQYPTNKTLSLFETNSTDSEEVLNTVKNIKNDTCHWVSELRTTIL